MGNWWLVASSPQCACSRITSPSEFFGETSNHPSDADSLQPRLGAMWLLAFPKTKSSLKGKRFQTISEIQENMTGQLMVIGRTVWGPKVPTLKGSGSVTVLCQCFSYLVSSSINVSFPQCVAGYLLDRSLYIHIYGDRLAIYKILCIYLTCSKISIFNQTIIIF